jgi:ATP synthase protein I
MLPNRKDRPMIRVLLKASMIGIQMVVATFIGLAIGILLDSLLGTKPWLTFIFLGLGIFTGFRDMYQMAKAAMEDTKNDTTKGGDTEPQGTDPGYQKWDTDEDEDR